MTVLYNESVVYCTIVLGNFDIMESALPSARESGLGAVDNSAICVGMQKRKKENHKASTLMKIVIKSQNMLKTVDQIKQQDVSKINTQPSGSQQ